MRAVVLDFIFPPAFFYCKKNPLTNDFFTIGMNEMHQVSDTYKWVVGF